MHQLLKMLAAMFLICKCLAFPAKAATNDFSSENKLGKGGFGPVYKEYSNFTIIHRDLKASNIVFDKDMNPMISDFRMAKLFGKDEHEANTDRIVGTI
ncbi:Cysteine-rich receptor-like protein kinase 10 [Morella rubra]|uniref:non-specific serine/threonine protein kinase n=1 Tax=Morella rubra TaxID=262757 RepID=A0A6A1UEE0_9ROSI|nr:Cysteine-rich receptor-like protein kinase 10 [Morella rubra]